MNQQTGQRFQLVQILVSFSAFLSLRLELPLIFGILIESLATLASIRLVVLFPGSLSSLPESFEIRVFSLKPSQRRWVVLWDRVGRNRAIYRQFCGTVQRIGLDEAVMAGRVVL